MSYQKDILAETTIKRGGRMEGPLREEETDSPENTWGKFHLKIRCRHKMVKLQEPCGVDWEGKREQRIV